MTWTLHHARRAGWLWVVPCVLIACGRPASAGVTLVRDGRATCTIVAPPRRTAHMFSHSMRWATFTYSVREDPLADAATDLADHLNEMAGIWNAPHRVTVVNDIKHARRPVRILLGPVAVAVHKLENQAASIPYPAYVYRVKGNDLLIFGSSSKGTANGVYGLLQDELGVRWFGPQELFRVVPQRKTVELADLDRRVEPSFPGRLYHVSSYAYHPAYVWARRRMRMGETVDHCEPFINTSHNLYRIYPPRVYLKTHPEYYPMRGDRRIKPVATNWTPCLTHPEVIAIAVKAAESFFRASKHHHCFSLGINDTGVFCECDTCRRRNEPAIAFRGSTRWQSNVYYGYVNQVARRVAKTFPDRYIGCIAYNNVTPPPTGPVEKNVHVVIVNDISEYFDKAYRRADEQLVHAWHEKGITLGLYTYLGLAKLVPAYFPHLVAAELVDKHRRGFRSLTSEVAPGWPWNGPMAYVAARLWWDVTLDVDKLLDEYFQTLYGPAGPPMSRLYALFEQIHLRARRGGFLQEHYKLLQFRPYTQADLATMRACLAEAHRAVPDGPIARRVAYVSNGLNVFLEMLEGLCLARQFKHKAEFDNLSAYRHLESIDRISALLRRHDTLYRETITNDPSQSRRYTWDTCKPVRRAWRDELGTAIGDGLLSLRRWSKTARTHTRVQSRLDRAIADYTIDPYRRAMWLVRSGEAKLGPNRVANPGFEVLANNGTHPKGPEWQGARADRWSVWPGRPERGRHDVSNRGAYQGKRSARMVGLKDGCYITTVHNVQAGQMYLFTAYGKCMPPKQGELVSRVSIKNLWLEKGGGWWRFGAHQFSAELRKVGVWDKLETVVRVPEGPASIVLLLGVKDLAGGQEVFFDRVSLQQILGATDAP